MWSLINDLGVKWINLLRNPTQWKAANARMQFLQWQANPLLKTTIKPVPKDYHNGVNEIYNKSKIIQEWMILWDIHNEK